MVFLPNSKKPAPVFHSCQRDPKAPTMTFLNQDMFYLKHGNSRTKKYILSLHKYPAVLFPDDDIEERTSRWKEKRDKLEEVYSNLKIVEVIRTSYELGHEHKFITELIVRRANRKINSIKEQDYKYLNKNDIEDLYLLCVNGKVDDYKETGVLVILKKYSKDMKYGYIDSSPSDDDVEYLRYYEEDIENHLKHRDQMRRWEMYVNGRLLRSRRDHLE
ncbi:hypothetical protein Tco_0492991 [Tanacetum coccineum]|uniref:Uncharacterized protein n=1 Tax=Tanacetum coccineum TaxID=301880 RepID=A0ABQ4WLX4_9ASTR